MSSTQIFLLDESASGLLLGVTNVSPAPPRVVVKNLTPESAYQWYVSLCQSFLPSVVEVDARESAQFPEQQRSINLYLTAYVLARQVNAGLHEPITVRVHIHDSRDFPFAKPDAPQEMIRMKERAHMPLTDTPSHSVIRLQVFQTGAQTQRPVSLLDAMAIPT